MNKHYDKMKTTHITEVTAECRMPNEDKDKIEHSFYFDNAYHFYFYVFFTFFFLLDSNV